MGVSNSEMFLSAEKDLLEINFLAAARPTLEFDQEDDNECEIAPLLESEGDDHQLNEKREDHEDHHIQHDDEDKEEEREEEDNKFKILKIKLPSLGEFKVEEKEEEDNSDGGFKTPTSLDHKIPMVLQCPAAPRKPKTRPSTKRKVLPHQRRILHDLSNEIEALFPPALLADLGNKIKKVRQETAGTK